MSLLCSEAVAAEGRVHGTALRAKSGLPMSTRMAVT